MNINIDGLIDAINRISSRDFWDYICIFVPIIISIINVWVVNQNTKKQIENQNKETYRPRLRLKSISNVNKSIDDRCLYAYSKKFDKDKRYLSLCVNVILENIGNGIANNISFYMLNNGNKCIGIQLENKNKNQILNSTLEIAKDKSEAVKFLFNFDEVKLNGDTDSILLICNYEDLNGNNYKILIGYILKKCEFHELDVLSSYSTYYYQESTRSYNCMVEKKEYRENYKNILSAIKNNR